MHSHCEVQGRHVSRTWHPGPHCRDSKLSSATEGSIVATKHRYAHLTPLLQLKFSQTPWHPQAQAPSLHPAPDWSCSSASTWLLACLLLLALARAFYWKWQPKWSLYNGYLVTPQDWLVAPSGTQPVSPQPAKPFPPFLSTSPPTFSTQPSSRLLPFPKAPKPHASSSGDLSKPYISLPKDEGKIRWTL